MFKAPIDRDKLLHSSINWEKSRGKRSSSSSLVFFNFTKNSDLFAAFFLDGLPWFLPSFLSDGGKKMRGDMQRMMSMLSLLGSLKMCHTSCHEGAFTVHKLW